jgi:hypothetical protein
LNKIRELIENPNENPLTTTALARQIDSSLRDSNVIFLAITSHAPMGNF